MEDKNKDCFYCGKRTCKLAGNPGRWPLRLPVDRTRPGKPRTVCTDCVLARLRQLEDLKKNYGGMSQ